MLPVKSSLTDAFSSISTRSRSLFTDFVFFFGAFLILAAVFFAHLFSFFTYSGSDLFVTLSGVVGMSLISHAVLSVQARSARLHPVRIRGGRGDRR